MILENIRYDFEILWAILTEPDFFRYIVEERGCGILLVLTNLYINQVNNHFDSQIYLDRLPIERVVQVHLAGGFWHDGYPVDEHSAPVHHESWQFLKSLVQHVTLKGAIIEWDHNFSGTEFLAGEVANVRKIMQSQPVLSTRYTLLNQGSSLFSLFGIMDPQQAQKGYLTSPYYELATCLIVSELSWYSLKLE